MLLELLFLAVLNAARTFVSESSWPCKNICYLNSPGIFFISVQSYFWQAWPTQEVTMDNSGISLQLDHKGNVLKLCIGVRLACAALVCWNSVLMSDWLVQLVLPISSWKCAGFESCSKKDCAHCFVRGNWCHTRWQKKGKYKILQKNNAFEQRREVWWTSQQHRSHVKMKGSMFKK